MTKHKLLHIEDEPDMQELVGQFLAEKFIIATASSGLEGIKKAQEFEPDLILMDLQLPSMSGYEATTRIRSIDKLKNVPIVAVTGNNTKAEREKSLAAGCKGFIPKPIDWVNLVDQVEEYLYGKVEEITEQKRNEYFRQYSEELVAKLQERIEELTNANKEMKRLNTELERINQFKDEFLANMSHELRTPLNSIIGFSEVLIDGLTGDLNDEQEEFIENILSSGQHLLSLINDILDLSKIRSGQMELNPEMVSCHEFIEDIAHTVRGVMKSKEQEYTQQIADEVTSFWVDEKKIKQVLVNLLGNASKFTPQEGKISLEVEKIVQDDKPVIRFAVTDNGIGINKDDYQLIFDEFRQVDGSHRREYEGTGLGLPIAKKLVELHGGSIWVESAISEGTTFYFTIPFQESNKDQPKEKQYINYG